MQTGRSSVLTLARRHKSGRLATVGRVSLAAAIAIAPVTAAFAQGTPQGTQATQNTQQRQTQGAQRTPTPGRLVVPIAGTLEAAAAPTPANGAAAAAEATPVTGTFSIQRFARTSDDAVAAVGTLTVTLTDPTSDATRTVITQAAMPLARSGGGSTNGSTPTSAATLPQAAGAATQACETLGLVLGPLDVQLGGRAVHIDRTNLDLMVTPGLSDRFGALLCQVGSQMDGGSRPAELVTTLNALLDLIG
jgi:hypothetical protein